MALLVTLPILIPLTSALLCLALRRRLRLQRAVHLGGTAALLGAALWLLTDVSRHGVRAVQMGDWPAPFGITFVADLLAAAMVMLAAIVAVAAALFGIASVEATRLRAGYAPLFQLLLMGVCGAFLTGDLFNLYVWYEVFLVASFGLLVLGGAPAQLAGAVKYVLFNLLASAFFLAALGLTYGLAGTLNMADLAARLDPGAVATTALAALYLTAFAIKAAAFPFFFWLPASYHTPPIAVTALFAGLLTKVGVYSLLRVFTLVFPGDVGGLRGVLLVLAGLTMVAGVLGAVAQQDMRRLLAFHIVSQIGYLLMGIALFTPLALAATIVFLAHVMIAKSALFLVAGIIGRLRGTFELGELGGLYRQRPALALLFLLPALALAGLPPLSGFWAKLMLVRAGLEVGSYPIVLAALAVSLLTLFSMTKIWAAAFWAPAPAAAPERRSPALMTLPAAALALLCLVFAFGAEPIVALATRAADQLLAAQPYRSAVLLAQAWP